MGRLFGFWSVDSSLSAVHDDDDDDDAEENDDDDDDDNDGEETRLLE